jgi:hypothetical protein
MKQGDSERLQACCAMSSIVRPPIHLLVDVESPGGVCSGAAAHAHYPELLLGELAHLVLEVLLIVAHRPVDERCRPSPPASHECYTECTRVVLTTHRV